MNGTHQYSSILAMRAVWPPTVLSIAKYFGDVVRAVAPILKENMFAGEI
jgi:hypothetical protein